MPVLIPALDALTMVLLNLGAATILTALLAINAIYEWTNVFVTVVAPLAAASFLVTAVIWVLVLARCLRSQRTRGPTQAVSPAASRLTVALPSGVSALSARRLTRWRREVRSSRPA